MKKISILSLTLIVSLVLTSTALAWGPATHAYIEDQLMKKRGAKNLNEIYGGMSCDLFNTLFESPDLKDLYMQTHYQFLKVWDQAKTGPAKALAYGFVTHNDLWGADATAHHSGQTYGLTEGYISAKAKQLLAIAPVPGDIAISPETALGLYQNIVESAVDLLVKKLDPTIGEKIAIAAMRRGRDFPYLLVRAYAADFAPYFGTTPQAAKAITSAETEFRKSMILYGTTLMQDEWTSLQLVSEHMADLAEKFFMVYNIPTPPREQSIQMITHYTLLAMTLCEPDYANEILETQNAIVQQISLTDISY